MTQIAVIGAGVMGLVCAMHLHQRGAKVWVFDRSPSLGGQACSWIAGGMLAPGCEAVIAGPLIGQLGQEATPFWQACTSSVVRQGTLVVAHRRDWPDLHHFAHRASGFTQVQTGAYEAELAPQFAQALLFADEAHLDPRLAMADLYHQLLQAGVTFMWNSTDPQPQADWVVDCRGFAAREALPGLRGVKGEAVVLYAPEVSLTRPVRLLHPRMPVYVVPRGGGIYMLGATMIESDQSGKPTMRSVVELMQAAVSIHPAFADAQIMELNADIRPAFADNMPKIIRRGNRLFVNGLYRHGFLAAPAMGRKLAEFIMKGIEDKQVMIDETNLKHHT